MKQTEWQRVASYITTRMDELVIDQAELQRRSGVSGPTVRALVSGVPRSGEPRKKTLQLASGALGWTPDSIERIRAGGKPAIGGSGAVRDGGRPAPTVVGGAATVDQVLGELRALRADMDRSAKNAVRAIEKTHQDLKRLETMLAQQPIGRTARQPSATR